MKSAPSKTQHQHRLKSEAPGGESIHTVGDLICIQVATGNAVKKAKAAFGPTHCVAVTKLCSKVKLKYVNGDVMAK